MAFESEVKESCRRAASGIHEVLRYCGDLSYAMLPRDMAHSLGDLKKSFWKCVRSAIDKELEWIDERVAGGDRLRERWQQECAPQGSEGSGSPVN